MCPADKEHRKKHTRWRWHTRANDPQTDPLYKEHSRWSTPIPANLYTGVFPELESSDTPYILYSHWKTSYVATTKDRDFRIFTAFHGWMISHCLEILCSVYPCVSWWTFKSFPLLGIFNNILWMLMHSFCIFSLIILSINLGMEVLCHTITLNFLGKC